MRRKLKPLQDGGKNQRLREPDSWVPLRGLGLVDGKKTEAQKLS